MPSYSVNQLPQVSRVTRNPKHSFIVSHRPFVITPICCAPVLPGETLKNLLIQSRAVTDPIKNPLAGWWLEYYFWYVRLTDFSGNPSATGNDGAQFQKMMIDPSFNLATSGLAGASAHVPTYFSTTGSADGQINYVNRCLNEVVRWYFRDGAEAVPGSPNTHLLTTGGGNQPLAKINMEHWTDSVTLAAAMASFGDVNVDLNANATITAGEIDVAMQRYEMLRMQGLTTMTWEEFLQTYGVNIPQQEIGRPELIRFTKEWQYPSNTVEPTTGVPTSAVSFSVAERADKDRFFKEPGFVFGATVCRPKVYLAGQRGAAVQMMNDVYAWMPGAQPDPDASLKLTAAGKGPLPTLGDAYWTDVRDLFIYGDQFCNFDIAGNLGGLTAPNRNMVTLPTSAGEKRYVESGAEVAGFFADNPAGLDDTKKQFMRQDGVVSLSILGRQVDTTPSYQIGV